jgi:hypothetical protein
MQLFPVRCLIKHKDNLTLTVKSQCCFGTNLLRQMSSNGQFQLGQGKREAEVSDFVWSGRAVFLPDQSLMIVRVEVSLHHLLLGAEGP